MNKILVTGATGSLGSSVIKTLLKKTPSKHIAIITRKEEKELDLKQKVLLLF